MCLRCEMCVLYMSSIMCFLFIDVVGGRGGMKSAFDVMFEETDQRNDTLLFPCVVFLAAPGRNWALPARLAKNTSQNSPRFVLPLLGLFRLPGCWRQSGSWRLAAQLGPYEDIPKRFILHIRRAKSPAKTGEWKTTLKTFQSSSILSFVVLLLCSLTFGSFVLQRGAPSTLKPC